MMINRKQWMIILLTGTLLLSSTPIPLYAAEFSDGTNSFQTEQELLPASEAATTDILSAKSDTSLAEIKEYVKENKVDYSYKKETDSYVVSCIWEHTGRPVVIKDEICGKKVTGIQGEVCFMDPGDMDEETGQFWYVGNLILPPTIQKLDDYSLAYNCGYEIRLPDSVTEIGKYSFYKCMHTRYLRFSGGVRVFPANLFKQCQALHTIEIPEGVMAIASEAFKGCPALKKVYIPDTVTAIGDNLFKNSSQVTIYGTSGSYAESYAKKHGIAFCSDKQISEPDTVTSKGVTYTYQKKTDSYLVYGCTLDVPSQVTIPAKINGKPVTGIGDNAFSHCAVLKKISLPETIRTIGRNAFRRCVLLEQIVIPKGTQKLGSSAFGGCASLKKIQLPDGLKTIGAECFFDVPIERIVLPDSVTKIGKGIFSRCWHLRSVTLGAGIKTIPQRAFEDCSRLEELKLPKQIKNIEASAFDNARLYRLYLPEGVKKIDEKAFKNCRYLTLFVTKGSYGEAFAKRHRITCEYGSIENIVVRQGGIFYQYQPSKNTWKVIKADNLKGKIVIPRTIKGKKVTTIGNEAFYMQEEAESIKLPNSITEIGARAFKDCGIKEMYIPDSVKKLGAYAFSDCRELKEIRLSSNIQKLPKACFSFDTALEKAELPKNLKSIGTYAFEDAGLKELYLPSGLKTVGAWAFYNCTDLQKLHIPSSVHSIADELPKDCIIYGRADSYAQDFAKQNGHAFVLESA